MTAMVVDDSPVWFQRVRNDGMWFSEIINHHRQSLNLEYNYEYQVWLHDHGIKTTQMGLYGWTSGKSIPRRRTLELFATATGITMADIDAAVICQAGTNNLEQRNGTSRSEFIRRIEAQGAEVLAPEWLGSIKPHHIRCANGHDSYPRPSSLQQGQGICHECANLARSTAQRAAKPPAQRYGWLRLVTDEIAYEKGTRRSVKVECLLCGEQSVVVRSNLNRQKACRSCALKLTKKKITRMPGVYLPPKFNSWVAKITVRGELHYQGGFSSQEDAARWADKITYESYGHTIFLHFPEEYDQSNDPVFVAV